MIIIMIVRVIVIVIRIRIIIRIIRIVVITAVLRPASSPSFRARQGSEAASVARAQLTLYTSCSVLVFTEKCFLCDPVPLNGAAVTAGGGSSSSSSSS